MSIIFSDDINDNRGEDLSKRVDTIYDYIAYMKEQLEFWARNRTREISGADAKIDSAVESIAENTEAIAENAEAIADLEPRIEAYETDIELGTGITVHKNLNVSMGLQIENTDVIDFPVDQGMANGWRYRKWNSGWFEAWHNRVGADIPANQSMVMFTVDLPFTLPNGSALYAVTFGAYQNTSSVMNASIFDLSGCSTTQLSIRAFRNYTETANWAVSPRCCIYIQGDWK